MALSSTASRTTIIQHYDDNPDRHDAVVAAVTLQKILPTPAPTPRGSTVSPQTPPRRITQEFEGGQGSAAQHTTPIPSGHHQDGDSRHESSEGVEGGGQPYQACYEAAEESIPKQTAGDALHVATRTMFQLILVVVPRIQHLNERVAYPGRLLRWQRR